MHAALGDVDSIKIEENNLTLICKTAAEYNILSENKNIEKIRLALNQLNAEYNIVVIMKEKSLNEQNLEKLKKMFGSDLKIIN